MKIIYICNEYPPGYLGGIGSFTHTLATGMFQQGHQVSVVGSYSRLLAAHSETVDGVRVIRLPGANSSGWNNLLSAYHFNRYIYTLVQEGSVDLIEGSEASYWLYPFKKPHARIIRMHGGHTYFRATLGQSPKVTRYFLEKISFSNATDICGVSRFVAEKTRALLKLKNRQITFIPNPVDINLFSPRSEIKETNGLILFIGTVSEKKGIRQLIQAMPKIINSIPSAQLVIIGRDTRDPLTGNSYLLELRKEIPKNISAKINFVGPVERNLLPGHLAQATVCVYPSHMEAMPIAWLEGMSMGKAVVASRTGPGPEIITDGENGLLCDPYSPDSIAEKILLLMKDPDLRQRLGCNARTKAEREFSIDVLIQKNIDFYHRCLS